MREEKNIESAGKEAPAARKLTWFNYALPVLMIAGVAGYAIYQNVSGDDMHTAYILTMDSSLEMRFSESSTKPADQLEEEVFNAVERLENIFSRTAESSDISRVNDAAGKSPVLVSSEVLYVTQKALHYAALSSGAFDPTIGPLIDVWGFLGQDYRVPEADQLKNALSLVDHTLINVDDALSTVYLPEEKMVLELGGIAKGYIVDQALDILRAAGVEHAFINAGGDIGLLGLNPEGEPWQIGVRHPRELNVIIAVIPMHGGAIVTSGDYERSFEDEGVDYHHILDPVKGYPARGLASVTIIAETAIEADALSTAVFVLGPERGMALIEEKSAVEGILITPEIEVLLSSGLEDIVELRE